jgi:hypothetical protein
VVVEVLDPLALPETPTPYTVALTLTSPPMVLVTVLEVGVKPLLDEEPQPHLASVVEEKDCMLFDSRLFW